MWAHLDAQENRTVTGNPRRPDERDNENSPGGAA